MTCCGCVCSFAPHIQPPCTWNTITMYQCKPKLTMIYHPDGCVYFPVLGSCQTACTAYCHPYYVLLPSGMSIASKVRPIIAVYSRFYDICVYIRMSVCTCIAQDHAHLTQVLSRQPIVHCLSEHHFEESPFH